jgi:hypothetical protein
MVCGNSEEGIQVDLVTLDSETYEKVDLVKIDVEGFEGQVLSGATRLISEFRPALFVEVHPSLLVRPYTTAHNLNFVREYYQKVRCYDSQLGSVLNKLASRYGRNARVREITDEKEILARREVFWMVGTEARA